MQQIRNRYNISDQDETSITFYKDGRAMLVIGPTYLSTYWHLEPEEVQRLKEALLQGYEKEDHP